MWVGTEQELGRMLLVLRWRYCSLVRNPLKTQGHSCFQSDGSHRPKKSNEKKPWILIAKLEVHLLKCSPRSSPCFLFCH